MLGTLCVERLPQLPLLPVQILPTLPGAEHQSARSAIGRSLLSRSDGRKVGFENVSMSANHLSDIELLTGANTCDCIRV